MGALDFNKYKVHCLVSQYYDQISDEIINSLCVHRINRGLFWKIFTWAKDNQAKWQSEIILKVDRIILRVKQVFTIFQHPVYQPFLARKFAKEACRLQKKEHFDLVISEYNGYETLYAGFKLKKENPAVKFMPIFLDSLYGSYPAKYLPYKYDRNKRRKCERKILSEADKIIFMESSRNFHEKYSRSEPYYNKVIFLDIPGIRPIVESPAQESYTQNKINMVYGGVLSVPDRNPQYFLKVLQCLEPGIINIMFFQSETG